jgi:predicted acylesterase/phospholipase RssA
MRWRLQRALLTATLLAAVLLSPLPAAAQHSLVLGGGGSRGLAHAGAIVALEELGYDMPVVVGASMGAIIGALYAAGYEAEAIRSIIADENWLARFSAEPRPTGPDREPRRPLLVLGLGSGRAPDGLVLATGVNLRLVELLFDAGARSRNDFDRLPRRFRAVAADLGTGAQVILAAGDLPRAVRASMAVPGAFPPVPWGNTLLIDGGIANNLPVSVARELASHPVLAVNVLRPWPEIPERNPVDVGVRGLRLLLENVQPANPPPELLVLPRIPSGFSESRFPVDASRLLRAGYDAARLLPPAVPPSVAASPLPVLRRAGNPPVRIREVRVEAEDPAVRRLVSRIMAPAAGTYDPALVVARTAALYDTGLFQGIWPRVELPGAGDDGDDGVLVVGVVPVSRTSLAAAAHWDDDVGAGAWASLRHRVTAITPIELHAGVQLGELGRRASIDASVFSSVAPGMIWNAGAHAGDAEVRRLAGNGVAVGDTDRVRRAGGWAGAERQGAWFMAAHLRAEHVDDQAYADGLERGVRGWSVGPFVQLARTEHPETVIGASPLLQAEWRTTDVEYARLRARGSVGLRVRRLRAAVMLDLASVTAGAPPDARPATTRQLAPWLPAGSLRGLSLGAAGVDVAYPIPMDGYLRLRTRIVATGGDWLDLHRPALWRGGAEIGAAWPAIIGRIEVGYARGAGGGSFNFGIGGVL